LSVRSEGYGRRVRGMVASGISGESPPDRSLPTVHKPMDRCLQNSFLERVSKLDEHYVNTTISLLTATGLRPKAPFRRFAERLFGLIYALPNSLLGTSSRT
jgi:hypothetical protein